MSRKRTESTDPAFDAALDRAAGTPEEPAVRDRSGDSRAADETHNAMQRERLDHYSPPNVMQLPPDDDQYVHRLIAEFVNGQHVPNNVQFARREGWEFLSISAINEHYPDLIPDEDTRGDGIARVGGLIMARIPRARAEARRRYYQGKTDEQLRGVDEMQGIETKTRGGLERTSQDRGSKTYDGAAGMRALQK